MYRMGAPGRNDTPSIIGNLPKRLQEKIITRGSQNNGSHGLDHGSAVLTFSSMTPGSSSSSNVDTLQLQHEQRRQHHQQQQQHQHRPKRDATPKVIKVRESAEGSKNGGDQQRGKEPLANNEEVDHVNNEDMVLKSMVIPGILRLNLNDIRLLQKKENRRSGNHHNNHHNNNNNYKNGGGLRSPARNSNQSLNYQNRQLIHHHHPNQHHYHHNHHHNGNLTRNKTQLSPSRHFSSTQQGGTTPNWILLIPSDNNGKQLSILYENLVKMIAQHHVLKDWSQFSLLRLEILDIYKQLLLTQIRFCCENNVDSFVWKTIFYNIREYLKELPTNQSNDKVVDKYLHTLIDEGIHFYTNLYQQLTNKYLKCQHQNPCDVTVVPTANNNNNNNDVDNDEHLPTRPKSHHHKLEMIGKVIAQKLLICLGDLYRYKIKEFQDPKDYMEATKYYRQAQMLLPSNGVPYNQLAIVSIYSRKKFDAVYFHMRCLMTSNPVNSSKESLLILFDEIRKKYEDNELKSSSISSPQHNNKNRRNNNCFTSSVTNPVTKASKPLRKVVWIHPDGVRFLHNTDSNVKRRNMNMREVEQERNRLLLQPLEELLRHMMSLYLYVIGKLFTGIGMETIVEHQHQFLLQFDVMLQHFDRLSLSRHRFLKILALNIAVMDVNLNKENRRHLVFNFCNQIFGLIVRRANGWMAAINKDTINFHPEQFHDPRFSDLNTLLQYIRLYLLWMNLHIDIWEPIKIYEQKYPMLSNHWPEQLMEFFANTKEYINSHQLLNNNMNEISSKEIFDKNIYTFEEDVFLAGFQPLSSILMKSAHTKRIASEFQQFQERLLSILQSGENDFLDNENRFKAEEFNSSLSSAFSPEEIRITSSAIDEKKTNDDGRIILEGKDSNDNMNEISSKEEEKDVEKSHKEGEEKDVEKTHEEEEEDNDDGGNQSKSLVNGEDSDDWDEQVIHLTRLKRELEAKNQAKRFYNNRLVEILKDIDTKLYIEVRPKYLLPDTNCFIDCLENFKRIVTDYKHYVLIVPLTVVKELEGLAKGVKLERTDDSWMKDRIHHYDDVTTMATKSLEFIKSAKQFVKCATTKGSIISASLFALVEEENISNDDKILATALALSKTMSTETSTDGKLLIQTELVLITTDRNLRVKALSRNLAVSDLNEFLNWAQGCCNS